MRWGQSIGWAALGLLAVVGILLPALLASSWLSDTHEEGDGDRWTWASLAGDLNRDGFADYIVGATHTRIRGAVEFQRSGLAVIDGSNGTILAELEARLSNELWSPELALGAGSGELLPDPSRPGGSVFVIHLKELEDRSEPRYRDRLAILELPSLELRALVDCNTHAFDLAYSRLLSEGESQGLPADRVLLLSSEIAVISLRDQCVLSRASLPIDAAEHSSQIDADGDGVEDFVRARPLDKLLVSSGRNHRELAYGALMGSRQESVAIPLGSGTSATTMVCTIVRESDRSRLMLQVVGTLEGLPPALVVDLR